MGDMLYISPTQVESYLSCPRQWWFNYARRMPRDAGQDQFVFGNVLHAVLERWFQADDNGRDQETGLAVDIYPEGWDADVSPADAGMIRKLVKTGLDSGLLTRYPSRRVERGYKREVIPGVIMNGKMDVEHRDGVDDHKSSKSRRYFLSEQKLADDWKMRCYAHEWVVRREEAGEEVPQFVTLKLNYFCKDPDDPITKPVAVDVEVDVIEGWWSDELVPAAEEMLDLKQQDLPDAKWKDVEGPRVDGICKKYRGCPHAPVCGRARAVRAHRKMLERTARPESSSKPKPKKGRSGGKMSLFANAKKRNAGMPSPGATKEPEEQPQVADAPAIEASGGVPPWTNEHCVACGGAGISSSNTPCDPCINISKRRKTYDPDEWEVGTSDDGSVVWQPVDGAEGEAGSTTAVKEPEAKPAKPARKQVTKGEEESAPAPRRSRARKAKEPASHEEDGALAQQAAKAAQAAVEPEPEPKAPAEPQQADSPDVVGGLVILAGCSVLRWPGRETIMLSDVLSAEGAALAEREEADSYYLMHPFNRRNMLAADAAEIAANLAGKVLVCVGSCPDLESLRDALMPFAEVVIGRSH